MCTSKMNSKIKIKRHMPCTLSIKAPPRDNRYSLISSYGNGNRLKTEVAKCVTMHIYFPN